MIRDDSSGCKGIIIWSIWWSQWSTLARNLLGITFVILDQVAGGHDELTPGGRPEAAAHFQPLECFESTEKPLETVERLRKDLEKASKTIGKAIQKQVS